MKHLLIKTHAHTFMVPTPESKQTKLLVHVHNLGKSLEILLFNEESLRNPIGLIEVLRSF